MSSRPTYRELALCLADFLYSEKSTEERLEDGRNVRCTDNMSMSHLQLATGALERLKILEQDGPPSPSPSPRFHRFTCGPEAFASKVDENEGQGCRYDALVLALMCLFEDRSDNESIRNLMERLELCEAASSESLAKRHHREIKWTDKADVYKALHTDWVDLLEN